MNCETFGIDAGGTSQQRRDMLIEVDFKWLMAGIGCWVDPERLHTDAAYASDSVQCALNSGCEPLRRCAIGLQAELSGNDPNLPYCV